MSILTVDHVSVGNLYDLVILRLGTNKLRMPYQTSFEVINGMRMASKLAMRHEGVQAPKWREVLKSVQGMIPKTQALHPQYRRSMEPSNVKQWSIKWEGSLVVLHFDELTCKMHYSDALRLHAMLRAAAHNAKRWAGDTGRAMRMTAYLNDAEENYKHGYAT